MNSVVELSTKEKILRSTRDIYLEEGLPQVSMRKVAKRAGISTMAAYRHFENKDELLAHVILEGFRIFQLYFSKALEGENPAERLRLCFTHYQRFALENPRYYEVMFMSSVQLRDIPIEKAGRRQIKAAMQFLVDRLAECVDAKLIQIDDTEESAMHLWAHSHGLVSLHLSGRFDWHVDFQQFYQTSCERMLKEIGLN